MTLRNVMLGLLTLMMLALSACQEPAAAPAAGNGDRTSLTATREPGVLAEGKLVPLNQIVLSFQADGRVAEVLVREGAAVAAGDPIVRLVSTELEIARLQSEARLASAQAGLEAAQTEQQLAQTAVESAQRFVDTAVARLEMAKAGPQPAAVAAAESRLAAAEASVSEAMGYRDNDLNSVGTQPQIDAARANVAAAAADLQAIEESYHQVLTGCYTLPGEEEVCPLYGPVEETLRAQLEAAQANQAAAQATLDQLLDGPDEARRRAANSTVSLAVANREVAQAELDLLLAGTTPEEIQQAEIAVEEAEVGVEIAQVGVVKAEAALGQAAAAAAGAEAALAAAEVAMERTVLRATFDGTVAHINTSVGALVAAGAPVVTLADFSSWLVQTVDLSELEVARIEENSDVVISFKAIPNETVLGQVNKIALISDRAQGDVVYEVTIRLSEASDLPMRWGMTVYVDVDA